jgi:hypothetical protein
MQRRWSASLGAPVASSSAGLRTWAWARPCVNHRASAALDYFISWRFFVTLPSFEYFTDEFQNIKARYTPGLGVGYEIVDTPRVEWDVTGSVAYQRTIFETGSDAADDAALIFGTDLELEITKDLDWDSSYAVQLVVTDLDKTNHHAESKLSFDVWGPVDFDLTFIWDRIENPETESDGSTPKRDDFRMTVGLAIVASSTGSLAGPAPAPRTRDRQGPGR